MGRRAFALLVLSTFTAAAGCRAKCADPPEQGMLDENALRRMAKVSRDDPAFCRELRAPRVVLTGEDLVLGGPTERIVARRADLPAGETRRIDRLFDGLSSYRRQWQHLHSGAFESDVELTLDPRLETPRALSVILSVAYAGFARTRVTTGSSAIAVTWFAARPVGPGMPGRILHVEASSDGRFGVRRSEHCRDLVREAPTAFATLPEALARACRGAPPCADAAEIRVLPSSTFGETVNVLRTVVEALPSFRRDLPLPPGPEIALLLVGSDPIAMRMPEGVTYAPRCWNEE